MATQPSGGDRRRPAGCVYCLHTGQIGDDQVLLRGDEMYLCAPRGQVVEGFVAIAPLQCTGCLAEISPRPLDEVRRFQQHVRQFYAAAYGIEAGTFYEQGRGGGGRCADPVAGFPLHAHLCGLPVDVPIHEYLHDRYAAVPVRSVADVAAAAEGRPYLYVESGAAAVVYVPRSPAQFADLESARLKPVIARLLGTPERGDWRTYPGDAELARVIARWRSCWALTLERDAGAGPSNPPTPPAAPRPA